MPHKNEDNKAKKSCFKGKLTAMAIVFLLLPITIMTLGFSSWKIGENQAESNISADVANTGTYKASLVINPTITSADIYFDATTDDKTGNVQKKDSDTTSENLDIVVEGTISRPTASSWTAIKTSLTLTGSNSNGTTYQSIYDQLIKDNYIVHPTFDALCNDDTNGTNNSRWVSKGSSSWRFKITSSFSYGSLFANMNPSEFFDSNYSNGVKKGSQYSTSEITSMLDRIQELDGAQYVVTMRVLTDNNGKNFVINSDGGTFANTNSSSNISYTSILAGDYVYLPKAFKSGYRLLYYYVEGSSNYTENTSLQFEPGYSYDVSNFMSAKGDSSSSSYTIKAYWSSTAATLTIGCGDLEDGKTTDYYYTFKFGLTVFSSNQGTTTGSLGNVTGNADTTYNLQIGDVIRILIPSDSYIVYYKISGFEEFVSSDKQYTSGGYYTISSYAPSIRVLPEFAPGIKVEINWLCDYDSSTQKDPFSIDDDNIAPKFKITDEDGNETTVKNGDNIIYEPNQVGLGLKLSKVYAIDTLTTDMETANGYYSLARGKTITVVAYPAIQVTWSVSIYQNGTSTWGDNGPSVTVSYKHNGTDGETTLHSNSSGQSDISTGTQTFYMSTASTFYAYVRGSTGTKTVTYDVGGETVTSSSNTYSPSYNCTISISGYYKKCTFAAGWLCLSGDTELVLENGIKKKIEDVKPDDRLLSFNHVTGKYEYRPISAISDNGEGLYRLLKLNFNNGKFLEIDGGHGLFDVTNMRYETVNENNVSSFVGHNFAFSNGRRTESLTLESYEFIEKQTSSYSIYTDSNINVVANGLLTIPAVPNGADVWNVFEFEKDLSYDLASVNEDIATYGLYDYSDWSDVISRTYFEAFNMPYWKVALGKGLVTESGIYDFLTGIQADEAKGEAIFNYSLYGG